MSAAAKIPVIGIMGGIGSGKSEVARLLTSLGCVVADSDVHTREILTRPHVRDQIAAWWGNGVVNAAGEIDRAAVGRIVFADPDQRTRLEALVHPLIHEAREKMFDAARLGGAAGARALVIDAPLLMEVGLDKACDVLVFVDAPLDQRQARVAASRGWSAAELERRESTQMPLEQKRARSPIIIGNTAGADELAASVRRVLDAVAPGPA
ncbi:MAG: dephospho-CoA kinase [Phycisphaerales bacterium]